MLSIERAKFAISIRPQADETGATPTSYVFDTNGCKAVHLVIFCGTAATPPTTMKIKESDVQTNSTTLSGATDVPLGDFSVSPLTLAGATGTGLVSAVTIPVVGVRKRYLQLNLVCAAAATFITALWIGEDLDEAPSTAAKRGLAQYSVVVG